MDFFKLLVIAATVEAIWQTFKMFWQEGKLNVDIIGAAILGIVLCLAGQIDFYATVGIELYIPYVGIIASGIMVSRGANFLHDLISTIEGFKNNTKA